MDITFILFMVVYLIVGLTIGFVLHAYFVTRGCISQYKLNEYLGSYTFGWPILLLMYAVIGTGSFLNNFFEWLLTLFTRQAERISLWLQRVIVKWLPPPDKKEEKIYHD